VCVWEGRHKLYSRVKSLLILVCFFSPQDVDAFMKIVDKTLKKVAKV